MRFILLLLAALLPCSAPASVAELLRPATARAPVVLSAKDDGGHAVALELRAFRPFADDARLLLVQADGSSRPIVDDTRYYGIRGRDDPALRGIFTLRADGRARGLLQQAGGIAWLHPDAGDGLRIAPMVQPAGEAQGFQCGNTDIDLPSLPAADAALLSGVRTAGLEAPDGYRARIAIETDDEFLALFGGDVQDATAYVGSLLGFISTIYEEEVDTRMEVSFLRLWEQPAPFVQTTTSCALIETAKYWNDNETDEVRTLVHFISGRLPRAGIAWVGVLCNGPSDFRPAQYGFSCPGIDSNVSSNYGGAYGVTMGLTAGFDAGNPQIGWDVMGVAHEIGHNFNSPHTHCYGGVAGNPDPVDACYNAEGGSGCWAGPTTLPGPGLGTGTLMSYCHLRPGGIANTSLTLGTGHPFGTQPERVPTRMFDHVEGRAAGNAACLIAPIAQQALTVTATPDALAAGEDAALEAAGGSGTGAVSFAVTQGVASCTIAGDTLTAIAPGVCEVTATKAGDAFYLPATATAEVIVRAFQTPLAISTLPAALVFGDAAQVQVSGGSGSGALTLALGPQSAACTLDGATLHAVGIGACEIVAHKAGDADYVAAEASLPLTVGRAPQAALAVTASPPAIAQGASSTLSVAGGSGDGTVAFALTAGGPLCSLDGNVLTAAASGTGTCTVLATRSGGSVHLPATASVDVGVFAPAIDLELTIVRTAPLPGETAATHEYRVTVANHGPVDAPGLRLQVGASEGLSIQGWGCSAPHSCVPAAGSQDVDTHFDLAAGAALQLELSGGIDAGAQYAVLDARVSPGAGMSSLTPADDARRLVDGIGDRLFGDSFE